MKAKITQAVKALLGIHSWNSEVDQKRLISDARVVLDVGANKGEMAKSYRKLFPNSQIYCFEPMPATFEILRAALKGDPKTELIQAAMSDKRGVASFHVTKSDLLHSLLPPEGGWTDEHREITVNTETIDDFCAERKIDVVDVLKIDVQGHEMSVFRGAERMFAKRAIRNILTEVNFNSMYATGAIFADVDTFLKAQGFELFGLYSLTPAYDRGHILGADALYLLRK